MQGMRIEGDGLFTELLNGTLSRERLEIESGAAARRTLHGRGGADPLGTLYRYWLELCPDGGLPSRTAIDPVSIDGSTLPSVLLIDVVSGPERRFRYRLVGTEAVTIFGGDYTGRFLDEILTGALFGRVKEAYDTVCDAREPVVFTGAYVRESGDTFNVVRAALPLANESGEVDTVLSAVHREGYR